MKAAKMQQQQQQQQQRAGDLKHLTTKFENLSSEHTQRQAVNPFSSCFDSNAVEKKKRSNARPDNYGRPEPGSLTEQRGHVAHLYISKEIRELCHVIQKIGTTINTSATTTTNCDEQDATTPPPPPPPKVVQVTFGELFHAYENKNNKVVGLLLRARRLGLVSFEGEMLWQRRDEHVVVVLTTPMHCYDNP